MAKILLILPPWYTFLGDGFNEIPVGLCHLAGHLNRHGHDAWVYNADFNPGLRRSAASLHETYAAYRREFETFGHPVWSRIRERLGQMRPDVVGIHFKTGAIESVKQVARLAREAAPGCLVVAGGPHPSLRPEETAAMAEIDVVVRGEGEETFREIADRLPFRFEGPIQGAVYQNPRGELIAGELRPPIDDLDALGPPDRDHLLDRERYSDFAFGIVFTARGCPFECTYCASGGIWTRKVRYRSPESIVGEIEDVRRRFGTRYFNFRDDTFTLHRARTLEICRLLRERVAGIAWRCDTRADCIDGELAREMRRAGCVQANVGIESGSERILKMIRKGETREQIERGIRCLRQNRISVSAFLIMGFPTETAAEIEESLDFAIGLNPDFLVMSILTPYPGTRVYDQALDMGLLPPDLPYSDFYHQSPKMGFGGGDPEAFERLKSRILARVERYNRSLARRFHRLGLILLQNPAAAFEKLKSFVWK